MGNDKYKIGDCVLLIDRDGSSIRRIISFYYNQDQSPIALGQFIYYQNEVNIRFHGRSLCNQMLSHRNIYISRAHIIKCLSHYVSKLIKNKMEIIKKK